MSKTNKVKFSERPTNEKVNSVAIALASIAAVGAIVVGAINSNAYDSDYNALASTRDELQKEYDKIQDKSVAVEDATVILNSAKDAGIAVAAIQNQMAVDSSLIGTENESIFVDEANSLTDYFNSSSACYPWYITNVLTDFMWEFNTTYSFTSTEVPVLWTCYGTIPAEASETGEKRVLLAYATGDYLVESGQFSNVAVDITALGKSNQTAIDGATSNVTELTNDDDYVINEEGNVVIKHADGTVEGEENEPESEPDTELETEVPSETKEQ